MAYDFARPLNVILPELVSALAMAQADLARPVVYLTEAVVSTPEGNSGTKTLTITARRSTLVGTLSVLGLFVQGTAIATDFPGGLPGNKTWNFPAGSDTATVDIAINGDTDVESDETFGYQLQTGSTYRLGTPSGVTGTILNDDSAAPPVIPMQNVLFTFDGDSKTVEMADSARKAGQRNGLDIDWSGRTANAGGYGVGGSTPTQFVQEPRKTNVKNSLKAYVDAGRTLYHGLHGFTNGAETIARCIEILTEYHNDVVRAAGVRWFFVSSVNPNNDGGAVSERIRLLNVAIKQYCEANAADTVFVDEEPFLIDQDPANTERLAIPYTSRAQSGRPANSVMRDGVHKSLNGNHRASFAYDAPLLARVAKIAPLIVANANAYGPNNLNGNLGGTAQRVVSSALSGLNFSPSASGTIGVNFENENVVVPASVGYIPAGTYPGARMVLSGAVTETSTGLGASLNINQFFQDLNPVLPADARVRNGILCRFNNLKGVCGFNLGAGNWFGQTFGSNNVNTSNSPAAEVVFDGYDGWYFIDSDTFAAGDKSRAQAIMSILLGPNIPVSGSVSFLIVNYLRKVN